MPTPIKCLSGRVEADYHVTMSWDFEAKLSDLPPEEIEVGREELGTVPLHGDWSFSLNDRGDQVVVISITHGPLAYAALGKRVMATGKLAYLTDGTLHHIDTATWSWRGPQPRRDDEGTTFNGYDFSLETGKLAAEGKLPHAVHGSIQKYRLSITLSQEPEEDVARLYRTPVPDSTKALQLANLSHSPSMDVRLLFKRADDHEVELWTTADFLGSASDYYKALFASGAAETVSLRRSKRQRGSSGTSNQKLLAHAANSDPSVDWEDSNDETDDFLIEHDWMSCTTSKPDTAELDYQQIEVRETAYSTMCAVLLYLQTGHIKFAPIRSSHALPPDELAAKRKASLATSLGEQPTLPPPVSPKSVYRLTHLLERDELQRMALDSFTSGLTISSAADELFSPVSLAYDKLRKAVFDFVVNHWKEVKATEAWRAARARVTNEPTEGGAQILFDLLAAIDAI